MGFYDDYWGEAPATPEGYSDTSPPLSPEELEDTIDEDLDTKQRIRKAAVTSSSGAISVGGCAHDMPSIPGLVVDGKRVPLPIFENESYLAYLLSLATPSPHGKGEETVFDPKVRSSLQIEAEKISFEHPDWDSTLEDVTVDVGRALSIPYVTAVPYKFLIYREGDHFDPHRDTEKEVGMVATLVVQLPSVCKGGHLVIHDDGKDIVHDFGAASGLAAYQCHFAAHYADIRHSVTPVTEGVRIAMVYNLVTTCERFMESISLSTRDRGLTGALRQWDMGSTPVVLTLRHVYTERGLAPGSAILKGDDAKLWDMIETANSQQVDPDDRAVAALVTIKRSVQAYDSEEVSHDNCTAQVVSSLTGDVIGLVSLTVCPSKQFVYTTTRKQFWNNHTSDVETTGNEGTTKYTTYVQSGILLLPIKYLVKMQISLSPPKTLIGTLCTLMACPNPNPRQSARIDEILQYFKRELKNSRGRFIHCDFADLARAFKNDASLLLLLLGICSKRNASALEFEAFTAIILQQSDALESVAFDPETLTATAIEQTGDSTVASSTASSESSEQRLHFSKKAALAAVNAYIGLIDSLQIGALANCAKLIERFSTLKGERYHGLVRKVLTKVTEMVEPLTSYLSSRYSLPAVATAAARCLKHNAWMQISEALLKCATCTRDCVKAFYEEIHTSALEEAIGDQLAVVDAALMEAVAKSSLNFEVPHLLWFMPMAAEADHKDAFMAVVQNVKIGAERLISKEGFMVELVSLCSSLGKKWLDALIESSITPRIEELQRKILTVPANPMVMPHAKCPGYPALEQFFHSPERSIKFSAGFTGIGQARNFTVPGKKKSRYSHHRAPLLEDEHFKLNLSCTYRADGIGRKAFVEITKTDTWSKRVVVHNKVTKQLIDKLQSWCEQHRSASPEQHTGKRTADEALAQDATAVKKQRTEDNASASVAGGASQAGAPSASANAQTNSGLEVIELD